MGGAAASILELQLAPGGGACTRVVIGALGVKATEQSQIVHH